jgi:hypothetical protein
MAVFGVTLKPGSVLVLPSDSYYSTRVVASGWWKTIGVELRQAPTRDNAQGAVLDGATLLLIETPTNPQLDVCDIRALVDAARARNVLTAVDNTTATAYLQQPLAMGATFSLASDTKMLTGHSDVLLGHVATPSERTTAVDVAHATRRDLSVECGSHPFPRARHCGLNGSDRAGGGAQSRPQSRRPTTGCGPPGHAIASGRSAFGSVSASICTRHAERS